MRGGKAGTSSAFLTYPLTSSCQWKPAASSCCSANSQCLTIKSFPRTCSNTRTLAHTCPRVKAVSVSVSVSVSMSVPVPVPVAGTPDTKEKTQGRGTDTPASSSQSTNTHLHAQVMVLVASVPVGQFVLALVSPLGTSRLHHRFLSHRYHHFPQHHYCHIPYLHAAGLEFGYPSKQRVFIKHAASTQPQPLRHRGHLCRPSSPRILPLEAEAAKTAAVVKAEVHNSK